MIQFHLVLIIFIFDTYIIFMRGNENLAFICHTDNFTLFCAKGGWIDDPFSSIRPIRKYRRWHRRPVPNR